MSARVAGWHRRSVVVTVGGIIEELARHRQPVAMVVAVTAGHAALTHKMVVLWESLDAAEFSLVCEKTAAANDFRGGCSGT